MKRQLYRTSIVLMMVGAAAWGKPMASDTIDVPTDRLIANLTRKVEAEPKNAQWHYELARVEVIAYAQPSDHVQVDRKHPDVAWHFWGDTGDKPPYYANKNATHAARAHLERAVTEYRQAVALAPGRLPYELGYAWCLDQAGYKVAAIHEYRIVYREALAQESTVTSWEPADICYACETANYLIPLLDPATDAAEIASLKSNLNRLEHLPRAVTPMVVPLDGAASFEDCILPQATVRYDLDGSGQLRNWQWISPRAGWLVYDGRRLGRADNGLRLIGSRTFWVFWNNGYDALSALDDNGDGRLTGFELDGLAIWRDANGNGICDPGEIEPLSAYGIVALSCQFQQHPGGFPYNPRGVVFDTGETRATYDWISVSP